MRSVELAAIGRRVCEVEWDLLEILETIADRAPPPMPRRRRRHRRHDPRCRRRSTCSTPCANSSTGTSWPATEGRLRFHARVAANVVAMVAREMALGPGQAAAHAARLACLGVADDAELAQAIRSGRLDDRLEELESVVRATVAEKLPVANPGYAD